MKVFHQSIFVFARDCRACFIGDFLFSFLLAFVHTHSWRFLLERRSIMLTLYVNLYGPCKKIGRSSLASLASLSATGPIQ